MKDEEKTEILIPFTINVAVIGSIFNLDDVKQPKLLVVDYREFIKDEIKTKLPAGRFQSSDIISSIETFLKNNNGRNKSLEFFCMDADAIYKKYLQSLKECKNHSEVNFYFNEMTLNILELLQACNLNESDFRLILNQTYLNTMIHELREETGAEIIGKMFISSLKKVDSHYKIGFVSTSVEAPTIYIGSPDPKILKSYWMDIDENTSNILFNGHKNNFQEGIRELIKLKAHPHVGSLERFLTAVN